MQHEGKEGGKGGDKLRRGAGEAEDKMLWERRLNQMWGVLRSDARQLDADSDRDFKSKTSHSL